jgi:hypothetical protein
MTRPKLGLLGLCAVVLGMMAISTNSALAAGSWLAGSTEITKTSTLLVEIIVEGGVTVTLLTHEVSLSVGVSCTSLTASFHLAAEGKLAEGGKFTGTGCTVTQGDTHCTVKSPGAPTGTIQSNELKGELVLHTGGVVLTKLEPKSAETGFATLRFEGECSLPESNKVTGVFYVKDAENKAETLAVKHLIEQGPLTSLAVGADNEEHLLTSIDITVWVRLTSIHTGFEWRAMGV